MQFQLLSTLSVVLFALSGCTGPAGEDIANPEQNNPGTGDEESIAYGPVAIPFTLDGQEEFEWTVEFGGGALEPQLANLDGVLIEYVLSSPDDCSGSIGGAAQTMGGGENTFNFNCGEYEDGSLTFILQVSGTFDGEFRVPNSYLAGAN